MTDRRDDRELEPLLAELAETLEALQDAVEDDHRRRSPSLRPPSFREVLRFTERQTIPTLVAILEANIRMLELTGAALRAMDPERSVGEGETAQRALDTGRVSADRLASGLSDLRGALAGAEATNPEARELLSEADRLSAEIRERLEDADAGGEAARDASGEEGVSIDVEDAREGGDEDDVDSPPEPDIDAELDSIRDEVRGGDADEHENDESDEHPKE